MFKLFSVFFVGIVASQSFAMDFQKARLVLWRRGEAIAGEDFILGTEAAVDYMATLKRPTGTLITDNIKYNCLVKYRLTQPSLQLSGGAAQPQSGWVNVQVVYELKDCAPIRD